MLRLEPDSGEGARPKDGVVMGLSSQWDGTVGCCGVVLFDGFLPARSTGQGLLNDPIDQLGHRDLFNFGLVMEGTDKKPVEGRGVMRGFGHKRYETRIQASYSYTSATSRRAGRGGVQLLTWRK